MTDFIIVKDALTKELMIIRKSMICTVEHAIKDGEKVRRITYTDNRPDEFVTDSLSYIINELKD